MKKQLIAALIFGAIGSLLIFLVPSANLFVFGWILAGCAFIFLFMALGTALTRNKKGKKLSGWKLFALGDISLMIVLLVIALMNDNLLGAVLLMYGLPICGALLVLELILYKIVRMYDPGAPEQTQSSMPPRISFPANDVPKNDNGGDK